MKTIHHHLRIFLIGALLTTIVAIDVYGQYGTSRRVARRTSRRTSARVNSVETPPPPPPPTTTTTAAPAVALPGGCVSKLVSGINYQYCDGVYYKPYYQGTQVVYVIENP